ncbi:hypothetical protein EHS25_003272 [Saitozyma podzolica]|uniref:Uncharacterized protein n=1 Tax=Saitozyma podzolica TaxID=1890683 RepID=A0A427Y8H2_9TREE|nr:hypothetical protein EHS25_003272 [Saitozyma podzolica]
MASSKATPALNLPSDVSILKTKEAAKHGLDASVGETEVVWPKPEFGPSTTIELVTKEGKEMSGFILPAGSMFSLGAAIPAKTVLQYGAYFPPGTMFPDGVLCPIHARMVSVQPIETKKPPAAPSEPVCLIQ